MSRCLVWAVTLMFILGPFTTQVQTPVSCPVSDLGVRKPRLGWSFLSFKSSEYVDDKGVGGNNAGAVPLWDPSQPRSHWHPHCGRTYSHAAHSSHLSFSLSSLAACSP